MLVENYIEIRYSFVAAELPLNFCFMRYFAFLYKHSLYSSFCHICKSICIYSRGHWKSHCKFLCIRHSWDLVRKSSPLCSCQNKRSFSCFIWVCLFWPKKKKKRFRKFLTMKSKLKFVEWNAYEVTMDPYSWP